MRVAIFLLAACGPAPMEPAGDASAPCSGLAICGGRCVDVANDRDHCGLCGRSCDDGFDCVEARCTATTAPSFVDVSGDVGRHSAIAVDAAGVPHMAYTDETDGSHHMIRYATRDGARWRIEEADVSGHTGWQCSLALARDAIHVTYYDERDDELRYATRTASGWSAISGTIGGRFSSLAIDRAGRAHVSHYDYTSEDLRYSIVDAGVFRFETVESEGDVGRHSALALGADELPRIAYADTTRGALHFAHRIGDTFELETIDRVPAESVSLALDSADRPHVLYHDAAAQTLRYAFRDELGWRIEVVDAGGAHAALALDAMDRPQICYRSELDTLRCAIRESSWRIVTADPAEGVGEGVDVALDASGRLHASYRDAAGRALKYVRADLTSESR
jgi:hypothetical protein